MTTIWEAPTIAKERNFLRRYLNPWNLVGLVLLPALYWILDFLWHALTSESRWLLLGNLAIPVGVSLAAFLAWKAWSGKLSQCASLGLCTLLGIYLSGPTYMLFQVWALRIHVVSSGAGALHDWLMATAFFPFATFDFSAYDATLPAPFLTCLGIWLARLKVARSQPWALSKSA